MQQVARSLVHPSQVIGPLEIFPVSLMVRLLLQAATLPGNRKWGLGLPHVWNGMCGIYLRCSYCALMGEVLLEFC